MDILIALIKKELNEILDIANCYIHILSDKIKKLEEAKEQ